MASRVPMATPMCNGLLMPGQLLDCMTTTKCEFRSDECKKNRHLKNT